MQDSFSKPKVKLVLGSGGARGLSHIGVIDALEENGYEIAGIAGCSMGAVVGGMYAAGYHVPYREWMLQLNKAKLIQIMDFTLGRQGFLKGERIFQILSEFTGVQDIERFRIPFTAVATDLYHHREICFRSGNLYNALRASIAIPGVFIPVVEGDMFLVDGGVMNPLPLNQVNRESGDILVSVNLNGTPKAPLAASEQPEDTALFEQIRRWLNINWHEADDPVETLAETQRYSLVELLISSYRLTQHQLTEMMLKAYPPDIRIDIPRNAASTFEFDRAKELIALGHQSCMDAIRQFEVNSKR